VASYLALYCSENRASKELEMITDLNEAITTLERARTLLSLLTIRQVIEAGDEAINAVGLNPYAMNEGRATGEEGINTYWFDDAIKFLK
jgi:hypothetical protein